MRPIAPVPGRMVAVPRGSPEPIIDNRRIDIHGFDDIVGTIDIFVAHYLNGNGLRSFIFLHIDRGNILIDILRQNGLQEHQVAVALRSLNDTDIIDLTIAVEVKVGEVLLRTI